MIVVFFTCLTFGHENCKFYYKHISPSKVRLNLKSSKEVHTTSEASSASGDTRLKEDKKRIKDKRIRIKVH